MAPARIRLRYSVPALTSPGTSATPASRSCRSWSRNAGRAPGAASFLSSAVEIYPHQVDAALTVLSDPVQRYLLADEVGLGKTVEAGYVIRQTLPETTHDARVRSY